MTDLFSPIPEGISFHVRVTPKAAQNRIGEVMRDENDNPILKVYVTITPEQGKANEAVIELLAKTWKLKKSQIFIKQGSTDRNKKLYILGESKILLQKLKEFF